MKGYIWNCGGGECRLTSNSCRSSLVTAAERNPVMGMVIQERKKWKRRRRQMKNGPWGRNLKPRLKGNVEK